MNEYDLVIIGGGPAGMSAGVYAARKHMKTAIVAESWSGQSAESPDIQNWIGTPSISGADLAKTLEAHVRAYADGFIEFFGATRATKVEKSGEKFIIHTPKGDIVGRSVLLATGGARRKLDIPGAAEFENKGVVYCASCDGPLFAGMDVAVIGGGNAGMETAAQLLAYAKSVTVVHRGSEFKADPGTVEQVFAHKNATPLLESTPVKITGTSFVESIDIQNAKTGETQTIPVSGVFVEIGMVPSTDLVKGLVELDAYGRVVTNPKNQQTSTPGIWAAGDCTDELYHQNNIAAGDAVKAVEDIYLFLKRAG